MPDDPLLMAVAASQMAGSAVSAAMLRRLIGKGLLSAADGKEIYEQALLMIEESRGASPHSHSIVDTARRLIEERLRS